MKKIYDLGVKTSEYKDAQGETRANWLNVGSVMKDENGDKPSIILLNRAFNPAGIPNPDNRGNVLIYMFPLKNNNGGNNNGGNSKKYDRTPEPPVDYNGGGGAYIPF